MYYMLKNKVFAKIPKNILLYYKYSLNLNYHKTKYIF